VEKEEGRGEVIAHIVLLQPKPELTEAQRAEALETIRRSAANLAEVRLRLGRRVKHGLPGYEQFMGQDFDYALIVEAADMEALKRYLQAPAHVALGHLFYTATSAALAYDYELESA
jgi:hypothetical protein